MVLFVSGGGPFRRNVATAEMVRKLLSDYMDSAEGAHGDSAREALRILDGILDDIDATSRSGSDEKKREAGGGASKVSSGV